jgi:anti-sigma regulatory factor (Ser/Thr protein kinase)
MINVEKNIADIAQYGFTEIFNNVIDHSASNECLICYTQNYCEITMFIIDYGIGIFQKIQQTFDLADHRSALLELSKGKITSDESRHSGEGIFFTSRMFGKFSISSDDLFYLRGRKDDKEWLIESGDLPKERKGTGVIMTISTAATWTRSSVFEQYQSDTIRFRKTHVPIKLGNYPGEELVSRSQAKRILTRFDQFSEVLLDFDGVFDVGQAFADEIFRVFRHDHPEIELYAMNLSPDVKKMIDYVEGNEDTQGQLDLLAGLGRRAD